VPAAAWQKSTVARGPARDIDAIIDAKARAVARQSPGVPLGVIRNLLTARAGACSCAQYLEIMADRAE